MIHCDACALFCDDAGHRGWLVMPEHGSRSGAQTAWLAAWTRADHDRARIARRRYAALRPSSFEGRCLRRTGRAAARRRARCMSATACRCATCDTFFPAERRAHPLPGEPRRQRHRRRGLERARRGERRARRAAPRGAGHRRPLVLPRPERPAGGAAARPGRYIVLSTTTAAASSRSCRRPSRPGALRAAVRHADRPRLPATPSRCTAALHAPGHLGCLPRRRARRHDAARPDTSSKCRPTARSNVAQHRALWRGGGCARWASPACSLRWERELMASRLSLAQRYALPRRAARHAAR